MIKKLLLILLAIGVGVGFYMIQQGIPFTTLTDAVQPVVTRFQTTWAMIPETVRGVILLGIPTVFATFFAWTKSRAMTKLQQTQEQAQAQFNQMEGDASEAKQQIDLLTRENQTLSTGSYGEDFAKLGGELQSTKTQLEAKTQEVLAWKKLQESWDTSRNSMNEQIRVAQSQIKDLQYRLGVAEGTIQPPIQ